jgi:hypothetical protein
MQAKVKYIIIMYYKEQEYFKKLIVVPGIRKIKKYICPLVYEAKMSNVSTVGWHGLSIKLKNNVLTVGWHGSPIKFELSTIGWHGSPIKFEE